MSEDRIRRSIPVTYQVVIGIGLFLSLLQLYSLSSSIYNEHTVDVYNREQVLDIERTKQAIAFKQKQYILTMFNSFSDKVGKEANKLNPGEKEIIIHQHDTERLYVENNVAQEMLGDVVVDEDPFITSLPVSRQWAYFLFGVN